MKIALFIFAIVLIIGAITLLALIISSAISHSETLNDFNEYIDNMPIYEEE